MWFWLTQEGAVSPTGSSICGGGVVSVSLYSKSNSFGTVVPQLVTGAKLNSESRSTGIIELGVVGTRNLISKSGCAGTLDIGRGFTVINETGIISENTNVLRFYGETLKSGNFPNRVSDVIVTTGCVTLSGNGTEVLQGGVGTDIVGGECFEGTNLSTIVYTQRVDLVTDYVIYKGWALAGSLESQAVWRIQKIIIDQITGDVSKLFADGDTEFNNIWDSRATYTYL